MNNDPGTGAAAPASNRTILLVVTLVVLVGLVVVASITSSNETTGADDRATPTAPAAADPVTEVETVLKNAATAEESYHTTNASYTERIEDLEGEGLKVPPNIQIVVQARGGLGYCITAGTPEGIVLHYDSDVGRPEEGPCPQG